MGYIQCNIYIVYGIMKLDIFTLNLFTFIYLLLYKYTYYNFTTKYMRMTHSTLMHMHIVLYNV